MVHLAANLTMLFTEYPVLERFDRAAASGFTAVEYLFPYSDSPEEIKQAIERNNLELVLMNLPAGDWAAGERGIAAQPSRTDEFAQGVARAVEVAGILHPPRINCLAGKVAGTDDDMAVLESNIRLAATALEEVGVQLVIEPVNPFDVVGFAVPTTRAALDLIARIGHPNVGLQFDVYHALRMDEDAITFLRDHGAEVSHIQIADVPGRHQPGTGEIDFVELFDTIDRSGYAGFVSLEYVPQGPTEDGFDLLRELGYLSID